MKKLPILILLLSFGQHPTAQAQQDTFLNDFVEIKTDSAHFYIQKYAVSAAEFTDFMETTGSHFDPQVELAWKDNMPATVTKEQAKSYLALLTDMYLAEFRLPTEAEWELAAAGTPIPQKNKKPICVSCPKPNANGIFGMLGNVWEWTSTPEPEGQERYFVIKGGDYQEDKETLTVNTRYTVSLDMNMMYIGFRMAIDAKDYERLMDVEEANSIVSELLPDEHLVITPYQVIVDDMELDISATEFPIISINDTNNTFSLCCVHGYNQEMEIALMKAISFDYGPGMLPKLKRFQTLINRIVKNNYPDEN